MRKPMFLTASTSAGPASLTIPGTVPPIVALRTSLGKARNPCGVGMRCTARHARPTIDRSYFSALSAIDFGVSRGEGTGTPSKWLSV